MRHCSENTARCTGRTWSNSVFSSFLGEAWPHVDCPGDSRRFTVPEVRFADAGDSDCNAKSAPVDIHTYLPWLGHGEAEPK